MRRSWPDLSGSVTAGGGGDKGEKFQNISSSCGALLLLFLGLLKGSSFGKFLSSFSNIELFFLIGMLSMSAILISSLSFLICERADKQIKINGLFIIYSVEIDIINEE